MNLDRTAVLSLGLTVLLVASVLPPGLAGLVGTASADHHDAPVYTVRQPGTDLCYEIKAYSHDHPKMVPEVEVRGTNTVGDVTGPYRDPDWDGFESIESIMDYRYHDDGRGQTEYYAPYLNTPYMYENWNYGTYGLYNWSDNGESHMFFYENANGEVSLVVRHDRMNDDEYPTASHRKYNGIYGGIAGDGFHVDSPGGGEATWQFRNLPEGEWAYIDDMYPRQNMDDVYTDGDGTRYGHREAEYESRPLREFSGGEFNVNWFWGPGGNDGGAYRGMQNLAEDESVTIEPESFRNVDAWEVRSNTGHDDMNGTMEELRMNRSVVIERGANCFSGNFEASPTTPEVGQSVTFTVDGDADQYQWDFDGDGAVEQNTTDASVSHAYETDGEMEATVTLVTGGGTQEAATTVEVQAGEPPTADFGVDDNAGDADHLVAGETVTLDGSASSDNSGVIDGYEWSVDGTTKTGDRTRHAFDSPGTYDVTLAVTDATGRTDTVTKSVTVLAQDDPSAAAEASPTQVEAGAPITLDGSDSSDGNASVDTYEWSVPSGAGTVSDDDASTPEADVTFESSGEYRVNLTVTDTNGNTDTDSVAVDVTPGDDPVIESTDVPSEVSVSGTLDVSASARDNSSGSLDYVWSFRQNGNVDDATGRSASYQFDEVGDASVKLTVRDAAGRAVESNWTTVSVTAAPSASLSVPDEADVGDSVTLDASGSSDEDGEIREYRWDFDGDGEVDRNTTDEATVSYTYESADTYEPTVTVVDEDGQTASESASIAVEERDSSQSGGDDSSEDRKALSDSGGGGGGTSLGPPPVVIQTEKAGPNSALVDVRNARSDETVEADLPESDATEETGVGFERLALDLRDDDTHVAFESAAGATVPKGVAELDAPDETLAYLDLDAKYLDTAVANATVEFTVNRSALGGLSAGDDVAVYRYDAGWQPVDASVVAATGDRYRLRATADGLGTLAVGANSPLAVGDASLESGTVATGDPVEATATVENAGTAARSATLNLTLDGTAVASRTVEVPAGETTEVTLSGPAPAAGSYDVSVGGAAVGNLTVKETIPADTSVTGVALNASTIEAGERVEITATVENAGGEPGERAVTLTMFGEAVATKNVTVPGGETREVTFVRQVNAAGNYTVEVGSRTASLGVTGGEDGGLGSAAPDVPGFGVEVTLVALLAATLLARLRD
ncbi:MULTISPECIES: PKD domain-containing protein [Halorussus]|uniref:PKD domain-containing protein n=1 Tax=Halorussus TaxID=1070314 RepID=UPI000E216098|nr:MULTISPECIES: PKD domain-containing protein [Halorussus]NHN61333.1 PKD domain-containing protein [Halorussus sp. JP-T4]